MAKKRMEVWVKLYQLLKILLECVITKTYANDYKETITCLIQAIKQAWGEKDITYYLVEYLFRKYFSLLKLFFKLILAKV